jgi:hypothetical protein
MTKRNWRKDDHRMVGPYGIPEEHLTTADKVAIMDVPNVWDGSLPPVGYVCSECAMPTETEPCREHQPRAWRAGGYA